MKTIKLITTVNEIKENTYTHLSHIGLHPTTKLVPRLASLEKQLSLYTIEINGEV